MTTYQGERQLDALGDSSRRAIISELAGGPVAVGALAERLPISRPAVSQHLRVLEEAQLVRVEARGTRRFYSLDTTGVAQVRSFLDAFWREDLAEFASYVHQQLSDRATGPHHSNSADHSNSGDRSNSPDHPNSIDYPNSPDHPDSPNHSNSIEET